MKSVDIVYNILCIGDSLALPRDGVGYAYTWAYKIANVFPSINFIERFTRSGTTELLRSPDSLEYYLPTTVIIQLGIVDCAPRLFSNTSWIPKFFNRTPERVQRVIWGWIKRNKTRSSKNSYVNPVRFEENIRDYLKRCKRLGVKKIIFIEIGMPGKTMIFKNDLIVENVDYYNSIIKKVIAPHKNAISISPLKSGDDKYYIEDGYHLSRLGNDIVVNKLRAELIKEA